MIRTAGVGVGPSSSYGRRASYTPSDGIRSPEIPAKTVDHCEALASKRDMMSDEEILLELHPDKTRQVDLSRGGEGFDFLGCHLRQRMSGRLWERTRTRV